MAPVRCGRGRTAPLTACEDLSRPHRRSRMRIRTKRPDQMSTTARSAPSLSLLCSLSPRKLLLSAFGSLLKKKQKTTTTRKQSSSICACRPGRGTRCELSVAPFPFRYVEILDGAQLLLGSPRAVIAESSAAFFFPPLARPLRASRSAQTPGTVEERRLSDSQSISNETRLQK